MLFFKKLLNYIYFYVKIELVKIKTRGSDVKEYLVESTDNETRER